MVTKNMYQPSDDTSWCPGCGNFPLRKALIQALSKLNINPHQVALFTGIGQAAKMAHYIKVNGFNGLHGRSLPPAIGMRVANHKMKVIVESGDGCTYGEGGNHFIHNIRRNPDITHLVHNNQIYGLTKGQASPTTGPEITTGVQPRGVTAEPFQPIKTALAMGATFVARGYVGELDHLAKLIKAAIKHRGYALIDILQPCVTFNKVNTYQWYKERAYKLGDDYDPTDYQSALQKAEEWGDEIPIGIIYQDDKPIFRDNFEQLPKEPLVEQELNPKDVKYLLEEFK